MILKIESCCGQKEMKYVNFKQTINDWHYNKPATKSIHTHRTNDTRARAHKYHHKFTVRKELWSISAEFDPFRTVRLSAVLLLFFNFSIFTLLWIPKDYNDALVFHRINAS